jgi:cytochrome c-type biogenesis protein
MNGALTDNLVQWIEGASWLAPLAALVGGLLTAANPCVLSMIPLMMAYVAGRPESRNIGSSFLLSLLFAIGLTITFGLLFMATWAAGSFLQAGVWTYIAAAVCLLMGLHLLGVIEFTIPAPVSVRPEQKGIFGALLLGMLFGLVSLPCAGPILLALLSVVPLKGALFGAALLGAYSLGHCALILIGGTSIGLAKRMIESRGLKKANHWLCKGAGLVIIAVGALLLIQA